MIENFDKYVCEFQPSLLQEIQEYFGKTVDVYDYFENKWHIGVDKISFAAQYGQTKYMFFGDKNEIESWALPEY